MVKERTLALTHTHLFLRPLNNIFLLRRILEGTNELIHYLSSNYFLNGNIVRSFTNIPIHKIFRGTLKDRAYALDITRPPYNFTPVVIPCAIVSWAYTIVLVLPSFRNIMSGTLIRLLLPTSLRSPPLLK